MAPKAGPSNKDGNIVPDYIIAINEENLPQIKLYLNNLSMLGLTFENEKGQTVDLIFIKLFISDAALKHFSELYEIGHETSTVTSVFYTEDIFASPFKNPVADNKPLIKGQVTPAEKITIVNKVLENAKYGDEDHEFGISKLISLKIVTDAYPLHDGPLGDIGTNTRSQLLHYWSNVSVAHMQQPLDMIFRYFGTEVAFYFAWLEYFNIMLGIPAILGGLTFFISFIYLLYFEPVDVKELCSSKEYLCPLCEGRKGCKFLQIKTTCNLAHWSFIFDNEFTIAFAVFISFWATLFITLWKRKESKLKLRWNCLDDIREVQIRQAYLAKATKLHVNRITGEVERYVPRAHVIFKYTVTICSFIFLVLLCIIIVLLNMVAKITVMRFALASESSYFRRQAKLITMVFGSIVQVICIKLFQMAGQFVIAPHNMTFIRRDCCQPTNCSVALGLQIAFMMTIKTLLGNVFVLVYPILKGITRLFKRICGKKKDKKVDVVTLPQWEEEFFLEPLFRFSVTSEFSEMIIRYGMVSFFSKAFPIGALCALLNNLIELRTDAYKFVKSHRRPVPIPKSGIGAWNGILRSLSYFGVAMNAFVIAFNSDWVPKEIHRLSHGRSLAGYLNTTLSKYATKDYPMYKHVKNYQEYCYFRGYYKPPEDSEKYKQSSDYYRILTFRLIAIFVFEHIILVCNTVLAYIIPYKPESVELQLDLERQKAKQDRLEECEKKMKQKAANKDLDLTKSLRGLHY
ncbi:anoctamin-3-like isoform X2 [Anthonomus grandis grandis]|uniref:anoctamin-3-like isoform X2 n=1 Tax=Anthonomus grandis grandis TaxID=2921223 RepID=UPI0021657EE2|nr:anoctamin-3-like isoform X2 [Anthonomus grandis grandis]